MIMWTCHHQLHPKCQEHSPPTRKVPTDTMKYLSRYWFQFPTFLIIIRLGFSPPLFLCPCLCFGFWISSLHITSSLL
ncbi:hypothetical protein BDZ94DRAFT_1264750 [Collybia nuda]|uniref:Uncharacterized protein n=1 Tax=Collybia nuda TaxID=64659 RepID=A0A9P5Y254_9AGAR|nr:hypothetical protein BDZ94DRAFT_1264750 [Collybia nuda]